MDQQSQYPYALDGDGYLFTRPVNNNFFTVVNSINTDEMQVSLTGAGTISVPTIMVFEGGEMWLVEQASYVMGEWIVTLTDYNQRAYGGSPLQVHTAGEKVYFGLLGEHINRLRDTILNTQKASMQVVTNKPANPSFNGELILETSTGKVWYGHGGVWLWANRRKHYDLVIDDTPGNSGHSQYLESGSFVTLHNAGANSFAGVHIQNGDNHAHIVSAEGNPVVKIIAGTDRPASPSYVGQIFFDTDDRGGTLFISADGTTWEEVSGAPSGGIAMFDGACPAGWVRVTEMDNGKFPRAALSPGTVGGNATHKHTYSQFKKHTHDIAAQSAVTTGTSGSHDHNVPTGGTAGGGRFYGGYGDGSVGTTSTGNHSHTVAVTRVISSASSGVAETSEVALLPPYKEVVFCMKV